MDKEFVETLLEMRETSRKMGRKLRRIENGSLKKRYKRKLPWYLKPIGSLLYFDVGYVSKTRYPF